MSKKLKIALPKGSLQDSTVELFRKAGYNVYVSSRGYRPCMKKGPSSSPG